MKNDSGVVPMQYQVLVLPDQDDGTIKLKGGGVLLKPDSVKDRDQNAATEGLLIASSPAAFTFDDKAPIAELGQKVMFNRYAGNSFTGSDGLTYRLMNDKDIIGVRA